MLVKRLELFTLLALLVIVSSLSDSYLVSAQIDTSREENCLKTTLGYVARNRLMNISIVVDSEDGRPLPNVFIDYRQVSHDFVFSCGPWAEENARSLRRELGVEWASIEFWWREIEQWQGAFNFASSDGQIEFIRNSYPGTSICACIMGVVPIYPSWWWSPVRDPPEWSHYRLMTMNSTAFREYKKEIYAFVFNLVSHYKGQVEWWVTPRELNYLDRFQLYGNRTMGDSIRATFDQVVALHKVVARAIKDANHNATVILGAGAPRGVDTATFVDTLTLAKLCLDDNVPFDAVGLEVAPWTGLTPADYYDYMRSMSSLGKKLFPYMVSYPSSYPGGAPQWWSWKAIDEDTQAQWLRYMFMFSLGTENVLGFGYSTFQDSKGTVEGWGLVTAEGHPKKAYHAYKELLKEYTTHGKGTTDPTGTLTIKGLSGNYQLDVEAPSYLRQTMTVHVAEGENNTFVINLQKELASTPTTTWLPPESFFQISMALFGLLCLALLFRMRRRFQSISKRLSLPNGQYLSHYSSVLGIEKNSAKSKLQGEVT